MSEGRSPAAHAAETLTYATPHAARPLWVKLGLWGVPGRTGAWIFLWLSIAAAIASVPASLATDDSRWRLGLGFLLSAYWYWLAIRWMDRHDAWHPGAVGPR